MKEENEIETSSAKERAVGRWHESDSENWGERYATCKACDREKPEKRYQKSRRVLKRSATARLGTIREVYTFLR